MSWHQPRRLDCVQSQTGGGGRPRKSPGTIPDVPICGSEEIPMSEDSNFHSSFEFEIAPEILTEIVMFDFDGVVLLSSHKLCWVLVLRCFSRRLALRNQCLCPGASDDMPRQAMHRFVVFCMCPNNSNNISSIFHESFHAFLSNLFCVQSRSA